ncbi:recombination protein NinG [bacterium]|nr:recombination protein NinG [bacterium]
MAKKKKSTVAQEVEKAAKLLQRLVRLKASDDNGYCQCVSCGRIGHYKTMDGGHFYSRRHSRLKLFMENVAPQCKRCNMNMGDAVVSEGYRTYMIDMYGERRVKAMKRLTYLPPRKWVREEVIQFSRDLKEQIKDQEWRIGEI